MKQRLHYGKGFSLIELLVVVAIISLLVSILLPSLTKAKDLAKLTICKTQLRSFHQTFMMYAHEYDGWVFHGYWNGSNYDSKWSDFLAPYMGLPSSDEPGGAIWATHAGNTIFRCPGWSEGIPGSGSYGINLNLARHISSASQNYIGFHQLESEEAPEECLRIGDSQNWHIDYQLCSTPENFFGAAPLAHPVNGIAGGNFLFCDGQIQSIPSQYGLWSWNRGPRRIWDHDE